MISIDERRETMEKLFIGSNIITKIDIDQWSIEKWLDWLLHRSEVEYKGLIKTRRRIWC